jgi:hypothetical protein
MKPSLIFILIALSLWHSPVNADLQYECGEIAVVTTHAIMVKNKGYSQAQAVAEILEDAAEPEQAKTIISKTFSANTTPYIGRSYDEVYKINYKLCLAGVGL